jgi:type III secretion protein Q
MMHTSLVRGLDEAEGLPRLDARTCHALNRLYGLAPEIDFTLRQKPVRVRLRYRDGQHQPAGSAYSFRLGTRRGFIRLDDMALAFLLDEPQGATLPHELRTILLADALQPLVERLASALGCAFEWLPDTDSPTPPAHVLCFTLHADGSPALRGSLGFDSAEEWPDTARLPAPASFPLPTALTTLPVPLRLDIGRVTLRLGELRSITRGDIVAIEPWRLQGAVLGVRVHLGRQTRPTFRAEVRGSTLTVLSSDASWTMMKTTDASNSKPAAGDALDPPLESLEGLEVTLRFEAGQLQLPLRELGQVKPGHVFDLGQPLTQSVVRIVAHGSVVGKGQLVAIGEQLGVRVIEFAAGDV